MRGRVIKKDFKLDNRNDKFEMYTFIIHCTKIF